MGVAGFSPDDIDASRPCGRGLRAHEPSWRHLEAASAQGDALALASASASAARIFLADGDGAEALWHLQRGRRFLASPGLCLHSLSVLCELATLKLQVAALQDEHDPQAARHLRDTTRDDLFDLVRRALELADGATAVLQAADILQALGDTADADTLRHRVLQS